MAVRDESDLWRKLHEQYQLMSNSAASFDNGCDAEALRLATSLRLLLRETKNSKSLLGQLDLTDELQVLDTADPYSAPDLYLHTGLTYLRVAAEPPVYVPKLLGPPASSVRLPCQLICGARGWVSVEEWLQRVVIAEPGDGTVYKAQQLYDWLADKDGGAHVDPTLPADYEALSRLNSLRVNRTPMPWGGASLSMNDDFAPPGSEAESPVPAAVRQLAFEMMWTLHTYVGEPAPDHRPRITPMEIAYEH